MNLNDYILAKSNISTKNYEAVISHIDSIMHYLPGKTCVTKNRRFETILFYKKYLPDFINTNYDINTSAARYENRCIKKIVPLKKMWEYPKTEFPGLYMIGQCIFNPYTKEEFYLLKIGQSANINKRLRQYKTYNPHMYLIDTLETRKNNTAKSLESTCHGFLEYKCHFESYEDTEWFLVSKDFYLNISEKGFSLFKGYDVFDIVLNYDRR